MLERCPVLAWAASGAMALTGYPDGEPVMSPAPALALLGQVTDQLAEATLATGNPVRADPAVLLTARAALAGFTRHGRISPGGAARLLRAADGWCAVTLSRTDDIAAVPAILAGLGVDGPEPTEIEQAWNAIEAAAFASPAEALATAVQSLGVPAAALPQEAPPPGSSPWPPWQVTRRLRPLPCRAAGRRRDRRSVVDVGGTAVRAASRAGRRAGHQSGDARAPGRRADRRPEVFRLAACRAPKPACRFPHTVRTCRARGPAGHSRRGNRGVAAARTRQPGPRTGNDPAQGRPSLAQHYRVRPRGTWPGRLWRRRRGGGRAGRLGWRSRSGRG